MSGQPTEKHEYVASIADDDDYNCLHSDCGQPRDAAVHQPSAVQAPERIWIWHGIAEHGLNRDYYVSNSCFRGDDIQYIHIDAYEAQAVRIRELEDALRSNTIELHRRSPSHNKWLKSAECDNPYCAAARAALKPKEGK